MRVEDALKVEDILFWNLVSSAFIPCAKRAGMSVCACISMAKQSTYSQVLSKLFLTLASISLNVRCTVVLVVVSNIVWYK